MRGFVTGLFLAFLPVAIGLSGEIPNRLPQARVGEWLLFQDVSGERSGEYTRFSIVDIKGEGDDKVLILRIEKLAGAEDGGDDVRDIEIRPSGFAGRIAELEKKATQITRGALTVRDSELDVVEVAFTDDDGVREFRLWVSDSAPIGGLVKTWCSDPDFPAAELVDYGFQP
jgi:hypothetical protein